MQTQERFGDLLRKALAEAGMTASEAARLVGFKSRNSIFRILGGETSLETDEKFFYALKEKLGDAWPRTRYRMLSEALEMRRVGREQHLANCAIREVLHKPACRTSQYFVHYVEEKPQREGRLEDLLTDLLADEAELEVIMTGCCDWELSRLLADACVQAASCGRVRIRHYIDTDPEQVTRQILGVLPLVGKPWYNGRLVDSERCPQEMQALYRLYAIYIQRRDREGRGCGIQLIRYDAQNFVCRQWPSLAATITYALDMYRFELELLKPIVPVKPGVAVFEEFTRSNEELERDCTICSIKPDIHFNCVPTHLLGQAIEEGFRQAGIADGLELKQMMQRLRVIHEGRYRNMVSKKRPTHLVYRLSDMQQFMRTGVQTDHFFIQRAYTVEERREIIGVLLEQELNNPYFHVYFLKSDVPSLFNEMTLYEGKGLLLQDSFTGYALNDDHSEAVITVPTVMACFRNFFMDELLSRHVRPRCENIAILQQLMQMEVKE